jgi:hypothetical protein
VLVAGTFDYSRSALGSLDETNLNEPAGIGAPGYGHQRLRGPAPGPRRTEGGYPAGVTTGGWLSSV